MIVDVSVFEFREFNRKRSSESEEHGISFRHVLHFGVGRSQIEWKLKVKTVTKFQFSHRAKIGQNDHSNLLIIENTTVLSDIFRYVKSGSQFPFPEGGVA